MNHLKNKLAEPGFYYLSPVHQMVLLNIKKLYLKTFKLLEFYRKFISIPIRLRAVALCVLLNATA